MKVIFRANYHGGDGYRPAGKAEELPDEYAKSLIELGYADAESPTIEQKEEKLKIKTKEEK